MSITSPAYSTEKGINPNNIPILNLGPYLTGEPDALTKAAEQLRLISETVGFYYISNHGVDETLIEDVFHQAARFHAQSLKEKIKLLIDDDLQGYMPMGAARAGPHDTELSLRNVSCATAPSLGRRAHL